MKKLINLILCCVLLVSICVGAHAAVGFVPSKSTSDMTQITVTTGNTNFVIETVTEKTAEHEKYTEICKEEIAKVAEAASVEEYFGAVVDAEGKEMNIKEILGTDTVNMFEFCPIVVSGYTEDVGSVSLNLQFATPYEENEEVVVLIGIVTINADGTRTIQWIGLKGLGAKDSGIQVELPPEVAKAIQEGMALMAVASK